jgi:hypothetical protein
MSNESLAEVTVMLRVGRDEKDDQERQRVLKDWQEWLLARI